MGNVKGTGRNSQVNNAQNSRALQQNKMKKPLAIKSVLTQENVRNLIKQNNYGSHNTTTINDDDDNNSRSSNLFANNNNKKKRINGDKRNEMLALDNNVNGKAATNDNVKGNRTT